MSTWTILCGDVLEQLAGLPDGSARCCVTSPPYWGLRDYGVEGQLGLESVPEEYTAKMVDVFREVRRVLADDGTLWMNLGDSYANNGVKNTASVGGFTGDRIRRGVKGTMDSRPRNIPPGLKPKDLIGIPWRVAFALQADRWYLRSDIIWSKPNPMPESVTDRPTKAHEYLFLLSKSERYFYDAGAVREAALVGDHARSNSKEYKGALTPRASTKRAHGTEELGISAGRNRRTVWTIATEPYPEAHFATFPTKLVEPCILAGSAEGDTVLDPFCGSGTTGQVAMEQGRNFIGIELNPEYIALARKRVGSAAPLFTTEITP